MILFIDACVREESRTRGLAEKAVKLMGGEITRVNLFEENLMPLDGESLKKREACISRADYSDEMFRLAKQLKEADEILIAAPYWDLSFPAVLKCYIEMICVNGLTFAYNEQGIPEGLCRAKRLIYITTAGGFIPEKNFGFDYLKQLFADYFGITESVYIKAEGLDIYGADVAGILEAAEKEIDVLNNHIQR